MEGLGRNQPSAIDAVVREIVEILNRIDPDPHLHHCLSGRCKIDQQHFLVPRGALRLRRRPGRQRFPVILRRQQTQMAVAHPSGEADYFIEVVVPDLAGYQRFLVGKLLNLPLVREVRSNIAIQTLKAGAPLPLEHLNTAMRATS